MSRPKIKFKVHPKQQTVLESKATEILFGGAAGPGKSHLLRVIAIIWAYCIPGIQIYLFRRTYPGLIGSHMEGPKSFPVLLAPFLKDNHCSIINQTEVRWTNGSRIFLRHCQHEKNALDYQSFEFHVLLIDELTEFTEKIYRMLRSRVRAIGLKLPDKFKGLFPRIITASNPGNIGHEWVKRTFVDSSDPLKIWKTPEEEGGLKRQFVPALITDNPYLMKDDPGYVARLHGLGDPNLIMALLKGVWELSAKGSFFDTEQITIIDYYESSEIDYTVRFWDLAATAEPDPEDSKDPAWTVGLKSTIKDGFLIILDMARGRWDPGESDRRMKNIAKEDTPLVTIRYEEEGGSAGKRVTAHLRDLLKKYDFAGIRPTGSKEVRARPAASWVNQGKVKVVAGPWNNAFFNELRMFPASKYKDIVDSLSGVLDQLDAGDSDNTLITIPGVVNQMNADMADLY
jgi:predicted phage terminase large subunit-like protein